MTNSRERSHQVMQRNARPADPATVTLASGPLERPPSCESGSEVRPRRDAIDVQRREEGQAAWRRHWAGKVSRGAGRGWFASPKAKEVRRT